MKALLSSAAALALVLAASSAEAQAPATGLSTTPQATPTAGGTISSGVAAVHGALDKLGGSTDTDAKPAASTDTTAAATDTADAKEGSSSTAPAATHHTHHAVQKASYRDHEMQVTDDLNRQELKKAQASASASSGSSATPSSGISGTLHSIGDAVKNAMPSMSH